MKMTALDCAVAHGIEPGYAFKAFLDILHISESQSGRWTRSAIEAALQWARLVEQASCSGILRDEHLKVGSATQHHTS